MILDISCSFSRWSCKSPAPSLDDLVYLFFLLQVILGFSCSFSRWSCISLAPSPGNLTVYISYSFFRCSCKSPAPLQVILFISCSSSRWSCLSVATYFGDLLVPCWVISYVSYSFSKSPAPSTGDLTFYISYSFFRYSCKSHAPLKVIKHVSYSFLKSWISPVPSPGDLVHLLLLPGDLVYFLLLLQLILYNVYLLFWLSGELVSIFFLLAYIQLPSAVYLALSTPDSVNVITYVFLFWSYFNLAYVSPKIIFCSCSWL